MYFTVTDLKTAEETMSLYDWVISLVDVTHPMQAMGANHLVLRFEDDENPDYERSPQRDHVEQVLKFLAARALTGDRILIHCHAGISRSTAMCIACQMWFNGLSRERAVNWMGRNRKQMWPNLLVLHHFDTIAGHALEQSVCAYVKEWKEENKNNIVW